MAIVKKKVRNGLGNEVEVLWNEEARAAVVEHTPVDENKTDEAGAPDSLQGIEGVGEEISAALHGAGITTLTDIEQASDEQLLGISGISKAKLKKIRKATAATA